MSSDPNDVSSKVDLERRRVPLERKISLKFKEFRGFITEVSSNLSLGGMFIRTASPKPVGTIFDFELSLTDDFKLVQGIGEVLWIREVDEGPERPRGMGIRFLDLSAESRKLIQRIVEEQVAHGGTPFELEPPGFPPPPLHMPAQQPVARPAATSQSTLFHPTAAPLAATPPLPRRPAARSAPAAQAAPRPAAPQPARPAATAAPAPPAPPPRRPSGYFPKLDAPEPPVPQIALPETGAWQGELIDVDEALNVPEVPPSAVTPAPPRSREVGPDDPTMTWREATKPGGRVATDRLPTGFDEVARAFSEMAGAPQGPTVRLAPKPAPEPRSAPKLPSIPEPSVVAPRLVFTSARQPPRRRRSALPLVMLLLLALLGGAAAVVYFRYPQLLPEWVGAPSARTQSRASASPKPASSAAPATASTTGELGAETAPPAGAEAARQGGIVLAPHGNNLPMAPVPATPVPINELARKASSGSATARFKSVDEIWGQRGAAGTIVTIATDGSIPADAYSTFRLEGDNPRELVRLRGVDDSYKQASVPVGTAEVKGIRLGYHAGASGNELHVVIDLASPKVKLLSTQVVDNRLELLLSLSP